MQKIRVAAVSYLNTKPFLYGLEHSVIRDNITLMLNMPSACADLVASGEADIGLVPVAAIDSIGDARIISEFCIGAYKQVKTVNLYSDVSVKRVKKILLDYQSRTSVALVQILAEKLWNIKPRWQNTSESFINDIKGDTAGLVIGDRTFQLEHTHRYTYDLAEEWYKLTGLPFVFAAWVTCKDLPENFLQAFNEALAYGVNHRHLAVEVWQKTAPPNADLLEYFDNYISYHLDEDKIKAMELFSQLAAETAVAVETNF